MSRPHEYRCPTILTQFSLFAHVFCVGSITLVIGINDAAAAATFKHCFLTNAFPLTIITGEIAFMSSHVTALHQTVRTDVLSAHEFLEVCNDVKVIVREIETETRWSIWATVIYDSVERLSRHYHQ